MIRFVFDFFGRQHARKGLGFDWRCSLIEATPHLQMILYKTYENQDRFKSLYNFSLKRPPSLPHTLSRFIFRPNLTTRKHRRGSFSILLLFGDNKLHLRQGAISVGETINKIPLLQEMNCI